METISFTVSGLPDCAKEKKEILSLRRLLLVNLLTQHFEYCCLDITILLRIFLLLMMFESTFVLMFLFSLLK